MKREYLSVAVISLFFIPFILLDLKYFDDLSRIYMGYFYWSVDGRPLAELIMRALSFGGVLTDLYPYTYIISTAIASYAVYKSSPKEFGFSGVIILSVCFVTWNFIPNAAYRFDNMTMTLSLSIAIIAACLPQGKYKTALKSIMLVASLSLYQSSFGAYICISTCYLFISASSGVRLNIKNISSSMAPAIISILIYKIFIVYFFVTGEYASANGKTINNAMQIYTNINSYIELIKSNSSKSFLFFYLSLFFISFASSIIVAFKKNEETRGLFVKVFILIAPVIIFLSSPSFMLIFANIPQGIRSYTSFGASIVGLSIIFIANAKMVNNHAGIFALKLTAAAMSIYIIYVYSAVSAFYNLSSDMVDKYKAVAYTVSMYADRNNSQCLAISGRMPLSNSQVNIYAKYPFLKNASPEYADNYNSWFVFYINNYGYKLNSCEYKAWVKYNNEYMKANKILTSNLMNIWSNEKFILIDFKS